jgi:hypothetical protein
LFFIARFLADFGVDCLVIRGAFLVYQAVGYGAALVSEGEGGVAKTSRSAPAWIQSSQS